tara:strand:- start:823 stop:1776 length:954 start_codon:yes stop_codon:yes gene_type:complete
MAMCMGTVRISVGEVIEILWQEIVTSLWVNDVEAINTNKIIILELRGPRVLMAMLVGMALAVAGASFQSMLRNPLADPYLLGIASGAACGAVIALMLGWPFLPLAAFVGALLSAVIVVSIAHRSGNMHPHTLVLAGVVVNAFLASIIAVLIAFSSADATQGIVFWLMGNVSTQKLAILSTITICVLGSITLLFWKARNLDLLAQGEPVAKQLGLEVESYKWFLLAITSLLTGIAVAYNGLIGFVGLIVPHIGRFLFGSDNRFLIPVTALLGAIVMIVADTAARTIIAPSELPVGAITALAGGPFFLLLLRRARHSFT